jgi:L-lactate dehydrogenase complex protein LldG
MSARDEILGRVRSALAGADTSDVLVPRGYRTRPGRDGLTGLFAERVEDYRATVTRCGAAEVEDALAAALAGAAAVVVPDGFPWPVRSVRTVADAGLSATELDAVDAVVTAATVGIAETGTIVLTHGAGEGRRALSLVPDLHVCVVRADQVVADVPDAVALLDPVRPQTWISGPSATSDIELDRVEGVHGPRTLHVLLVG